MVGREAAYVPAGPERKRNDLGRIRRQVSDHLVAIEFVGRPRRAEPLEIARAGEGAPAERRKPPSDQRAVGEFAGP
jgi:hypothetical protein